MKRGTRLVNFFFYIKSNFDSAFCPAFDSAFDSVYPRSTSKVEKAWYRQSFDNKPQLIHAYGPRSPGVSHSKCQWFYGHMDIPWFYWTLNFVGAHPVI